MEEKEKKKRRKVKKHKLPLSLRIQMVSLMPKSKTVRLIIFILVNAIFISLFPILAIFINYPYGYVCWIMVFSLGSLFNIKAFYIHTERFPLNDYSEYKFSPYIDLLNKDEEGYIIYLERKSNIYEARLKSKTLIFDMKGCLFPISVITAYLGRQYIMRYVNRYKLPMDAMGSNVNISKIMKKIKNNKIIYKNKDKIKKYYLIKKGRTRMTSFMKSINGHRYFNRGYRIPTVRYHMPMFEKDYVSFKMEYQNNKQKK